MLVPKIKLNKFIKVVKGSYAFVPNGVVGKIIEKNSIMGLMAVNLIGYGPCNIWTKNLIGITEKEYFIKVLQGNKNGKL